MRTSYGANQIAAENLLLQNAITPTRTGQGDIQENQATQDSYGNPQDNWVTIYNDIDVAVNHHSDTTGNIVGPAIITPNRFVITLPVGTLVKQGHRMIFENETYHIDTVALQLSIDVAVTAYATVV